MDISSEHTYENESQPLSRQHSRDSDSPNSTVHADDHRTEAAHARSLQAAADASPRVKHIAQLQVMADNHSARKGAPVQRKENKTGLPDNLKTGVENLSGYSLDDVKVHYNSDQPAQVQAHAFAQGTDIHLASGQEKHLPHEAWHVVQQKQGRVQATMQMKDRVAINNDSALEREADMMGAMAQAHSSALAGPPIQRISSLAMRPKVIQRVILDMDGDAITRKHIAGLQGNDARVASNIEPGHREVVRGRGALTGLTNDKIYIVAHGSTGTIAGDSAAVLAQKLISYGLDRTYTGEIILVSCDTGKRTDPGNPLSTYAGALQSALAASNIRVPITAPVGLLKVTKGTIDDDAPLPFNMRAVDPAREAEFQRILGDAKTTIDRVAADSQLQMTALRAEMDRLAALGKPFEDTLTAFKPLDEEYDKIDAEKDSIDELIDKLKADTTDGAAERLATAEASKVSIEARHAEISLRYTEFRRTHDVLAARAAKNANFRLIKGKLDELLAVSAEVHRITAEMNRLSQEAYDTMILPADQSMVTLPAPEPQGCCYLTTACVEAMGKPDDCYELESLRNFRDHYMLKQDGGEKLIGEYYQKAPGIVKAMKTFPDYLRRIEDMYDRLVVPALIHIELDENEKALQHYKDATLELASEYLG